MPNTAPLEVRVGVDVGAHRPRHAVGLSDGTVLEEFEIAHTPEGFREFFSRIEAHARRRRVAVAMEG